MKEFDGIEKPNLTYCNTTPLGYFTILSLIALFYLLSTGSAAGETIVDQCPPMNYPYMDRPCNEGQAYIEAKRQSIIWLKERKDFKGPPRIERDSGYSRYDAFCGTDIPWIPFTGCGTGYYRPGATCASLPFKNNPNIAINSLACDQGCEFLSSTQGVQSPTGEVCSPPPPHRSSQKQLLHCGWPSDRSQSSKHLYWGQAREQPRLPLSIRRLGIYSLLHQRRWLTHSRRSWKRMATQLCKKHRCNRCVYRQGQ